MVSIYVDSLCELPKQVPAGYEKVELYVSMPVVALSFQEHNGELYLFVTDFTPVNAKFITSNTGWTEAFRGDGESHVFPLKVNNQLQSLFLKYLTINVPLVSTKTFIQLRFEYIIDNGSFYGYLGYSDDIKAVNDLKYFDTRKFNNLCDRMHKFVKPSSLRVIETVIQSMKEDQERSKKRTIDLLGNLNLFRSAKHPTGRALTFHQEPETQQRYDSIPYASQDQICDGKDIEQSSKDIENSNDSIVSEQPQVPQTSNISDSPIRHSRSGLTENIISNSYSKSNSTHRNGSPRNTRVSSNGSLFSNNYDHYLVNKVTIDQLKHLTHDLSKTTHTTFELKGYLKIPMPLDQFIVKPYGRTIKFSHLKFYFFEDLYAINTDYLELDFYTDEEICHFLGLKEVEECMIKYETIKNDILRFTSKKVSINVTRKVLTSLYNLSYWTCTSPVSH